MQFVELNEIARAEQNASITFEKSPQASGVGRTNNKSRLTAGAVAAPMLLLTPTWPQRNKTEIHEIKSSFNF